MLELDALIAEVQETKTVEASAVVTIQHVTAKIDALAAEIVAKDMDAAAVAAALAQVTTELTAATEPLAAAIAAVPE